MESIKLLINEYHYGKNLQGFSGFLLKVLLKFASIFYFLVIIIKNFLYKIKFLKEKEVRPFVICVGNLTTGGVGKTPIVCELANFCTDKLKKKTAVISRGYGAKLSNKNVNIIKNQNTIHYENGSICGDEALLIAKNTNNSIVLTCRDRVKAAQFAAKIFDCSIVILDDGFSNRKIKKDFTILAVDSKKLFGRKTLLPDGPLREPLFEAKRADSIVLVNKESSKIDTTCVQKLLKQDKISVCNVVPKDFYNIKNSLNIIPNGSIAGAFCAIGQPEQFYQYLEKYFDIKFTKSYADHHCYCEDDIKELETLSKAHNLDTLVTTQKDEVKIKPLIKCSGFNFLSLRLALKFDDERIFDLIKEEVKKYETK